MSVRGGHSLPLLLPLGAPRTARPPKTRSTSAGSGSLPPASPSPPPPSAIAGRGEAQSGLPPL